VPIDGTNIVAFEKVCSQWEGAASCKLQNRTRGGVDRCIIRALLYQQQPVQKRRQSALAYHTLD